MSQVKDASDLWHLAVSEVEGSEPQHQQEGGEDEGHGHHHGPWPATEMVADVSQDVDGDWPGKYVPPTSPPQKNLPGSPSVSSRLPPP